jgi:Fur family ferric uptake transcriptional regulator
MRGAPDAPSLMPAPKPALTPGAGAAAIIVRRGARATRARIDVLSVLLAAHEALTHHDIEARLKPGHDIDRVTLYRVLEWLVDQGLAHKLAGDDRAWRFSSGGQGNQDSSQPAGHAHAHFRCSACGKVVCLDEAKLAAVALPAGFRGREIEVTIKGNCDECEGRLSQA